MRKKVKVEPKQEFVIMNKNAKCFVGLYGGEPLWSDDVKEAKTFTEESKITMFNRYHSHENPQIVYL